ncbi:hypothetical protein SUGI_0105850 [Cryptomeria japonica]|nr:hypothetical protein SUGI_0105850 [Cryptomeria japonica]
MTLYCGLMGARIHNWNARSMYRQIGRPRKPQSAPRKPKTQTTRKESTNKIQRVSPEATGRAGNLYRVNGQERRLATASLSLCMEPAIGGPYVGFTGYWRCNHWDCKLR